MKFSHQLAINSVPDWSDAYINYDYLKKNIYAIEKHLSILHYAAFQDTEQGGGGGPYHSVTTSNQVGVFNPFSEGPKLLPPFHETSTSLLESNRITPSSEHANFITLLDAELNKICIFFVKKETEFYRSLDTLTNDISSTEKMYSHYVHAWEPLPSLVPILPTNSRPSTPIYHLASTPLKPSHPSSSINPTTPISSSSKHVAALPDLMINGVISDEEEEEEEENEDERVGFPLLSGSHSSLPSSSIYMHHSFLQKSLWAQPILKTQRTLFKRQLLECYVDLADLRDYIKLNQTGFSKILKKYDKLIATTPLRSTYMSKVLSAYPFLKSTLEELEHKLHWTTELYTRVVTFGDSTLATAELKCLLREHITYERNTIWRDMISKEREVLSIGVNKTMSTSATSHSSSSSSSPSSSSLFTCSCFGWKVFKFPSNFMKPSFFCIGLMLLGLCLHSTTFQKREQQSCLALVVFVSWLWATETFPLFVTSLSIPLLVVLLQILRDPITLLPLDTHAATKFIFSTMFSPVIMLLLGGFSIAAALSKHHIAKALAVSLLKKAGTRSIYVLLVIMVIASFSSMWISNVASPVLCFSIIQPILRTLPPAGAPLGKALVLGIALASNIGGMASPIASPQNLIALENMNPAPSWTVWFFISIPLCLVSIVIVWLLLLLVYRPHLATPDIVPLRSGETQFTWKQYAVLSVTFLTIVLWCFENAIEPWVGDMAVIAILPIVCFFGLGLLTKEDFNHFLWTVIMLAMGGIALGKTVENTGLLKSIAVMFQSMVSNYSLWEITLTFTLLLLLVATFISHTVAALIILPLVKAIGDQFPEPHSRLLVMASAFMCSGAMGLPVSGFPNMNAISQEDPTGQPYLTTWDFIIAGIPGSVCVWFAIVTLGYALMVLLGL